MSELACGIAPYLARNEVVFNTAQRGTSMTHTILRLPSVKAATGLSRSTIYLRIAQQEFTHPVSLGARAVGWPAHEVAALNAARIAGKPEAEIRALVVKLEAARVATE
jgi:prophage regulatory protein